MRFFFFLEYYANFFNLGKKEIMIYQKKKGR